MKIICLISQVNCFFTKEKTDSIFGSNENKLTAYDRVGIESALSLRDKLGGQVTVMAVDFYGSSDLLREALAMGCDNGIQIMGSTMEEFDSRDTLYISSVFAEALKETGFDIIMLGSSDISGEPVQIGPQIAELLGINHVSYAKDLELSDGHFVIKKQHEDRTYSLKINTPCLIIALPAMAKPIIVSVASIMSAFEKEIKKLSIDEFDSSLILRDNIEVVDVFSNNMKKSSLILENISDEEAVGAIISKMEEINLI